MTYLAFKYAGACTCALLQRETERQRSDRERGRRTERERERQIESVFGSACYIEDSYLARARREREAWTASRGVCVQG
jgi:hypothetical protein